MHNKTIAGERIIDLAYVTEHCLIPKKELISLRRSSTLGTFTESFESSVIKLRSLAFLTIPALLQHYNKITGGHYDEDNLPVTPWVQADASLKIRRPLADIMNMLIAWAGGKHKFMFLFGAEVVNKGRHHFSANNIWIALQESFPECPWEFVKDDLRKQKDLTTRGRAYHLTITADDVKLYGSRLPVRKLSNSQQHKIKKMKIETLFALAKENALTSLYNVLHANDSANRPVSYFKKLYQKNAPALARIILSYIYDTQSYENVCTGTLFHKQKYHVESLTNPDLTMNWKKILVKILPECFPDESYIDDLLTQVTGRMIPYHLQLPDGTTKRFWKKAE